MIRGRAETIIIMRPVRFNDIFLVSYFLLKVYYFTSSYIHKNNDYSMNDDVAE